MTSTKLFITKNLFQIDFRIRKNSKSENERKSSKNFYYIRIMVVNNLTEINMSMKLKKKKNETKRKEIIAEWTRTTILYSLMYKVSKLKIEINFRFLVSKKKNNNYCFIL